MKELIQVTFSAKVEVGNLPKGATDRLGVMIDKAVALVEKYVNKELDKEPEAK